MHSFGKDYESALMRVQISSLACANDMFTHDRGNQPGKTHLLPGIAGCRVGLGALGLGCDPPNFRLPLSLPEQPGHV